MRKATGVILVVVLAVAAIAFGVYRWSTNEFIRPGPLRQAVRTEVPAGASVRAVVRQLGDQGIIEDPRAVGLYLRAHNLRPKIKAGTYDFPAAASPAQIFQMLEQGLVVLEQLTAGCFSSDLRSSANVEPSTTVSCANRSRNIRR